MDINDIRILVTITSMMVFIGIVAWAWSRKNQAQFDEAARLPFQEGEGASATGVTRAPHRSERPEQADKAGN